MGMRSLMQIVEGVSGPITLRGYHGSGGHFTAFTNRPLFVSDDYEGARQHALADAEVDGGTPRVYEVETTIHNPIVLPEMDLQNLGYGDELLPQLRQQGYDGAFLDNGSHREWVQFDGTKVRVLKVHTLDKIV